MEYVNGKPSSALSDTVDYSRILHNGVPRDELEALLREHDRAKEAELSSLRREVNDLTSRAEAGLPEDNSTDRTVELRSEVSQLRQEFATAMASLRGLLSGGDGNLHEMQLASLRRQVSQLEGVLESNYQRELRVAEERESALRSEMAQMRQDLRVALETLYRMPDEGTAPSASLDLKPLEDQITELGSSFFRLSNEQQALALEREGTLKAELAHMRRDLLVTLEASYQLPTERVEALDSQIASWHGQVEELQRVVLGMQDAQGEAATQQQSALHAEMHELRQDIQTTLVSSLPQSEHEDLLEQRNVTNLLAERLDRQASEAGSHFEQLAELLTGGASALQVQFETLRADLQVIAHAADDNQMLDLLSEREQTLSQDIAALHRDLAAISEAVTPSAGEPVSDGAELQALRDSVTALAADLAQTRNEQQALLQAQIETVREDIATGHGAMLEAARAGRESRDEGPVLTVESIGEMIGSRLGEVQSHWSAAQTELYRQLVSQMAEVQADLDLVNTGIQAVQPIENEGSELESSLVEKVNQILAHQQLQDVGKRDSVPAEMLDVIRAEIQAIRDDLQATVQEHSTPADEPALSAPHVSIDDVMREISARLDAERAEEARLSSDRDAMLHHQFEQIRRDVQSAVQQVGMTVVEEGTTGSILDLSELRSDIAELRDSVTQIPASHDGELRTELGTLRQDLLAALDARQAQPAPSPSDDVDGVDALADRMTELELALQRSQEEHERRLAERDELLYSQLGELRSTVSSALEEPEPASDEGAGELWQAELAQLRSEIADLAHRSVTPEVHDDSAIIELVSTVRNEVHDALEAMRTTDSSSDVTPSSQLSIQEGLTALAISIQQATANQDRLIEAQQQTLQAAIAQMRDEIHTAVSGLTRESVDSFEKRQNQLRLDQLEMERNLAQLRQELVATQADPSNKKKLWR